MSRVLLVTLHPRWVHREPEDPGSGIVGIQFDCPCGTPPAKCECGEPTCPSKDAPGCGWSPFHILFSNPPDGGPTEGIERQQWEREGDTFETLTLRPSINAVGHWHGFLTNGVLEACS